MKVCSIIVCYHPDTQRLLRLCDSLLASGSQVVLVDNTESSYIAEHPGLSRCERVILGKNTGIAHAQNVGIERARSGGAEVIAFFDQDSQVDSGFLAALIAPLRPGLARIVSPVYMDEVKGFELPSTRLSRYGLPVATYISKASQPCPVDIVMSSGTAATKEVFDIAGLLDEEFFIDLVDTEWCLRCRSKGIPIEVVPAAVMRHSVGTASVGLGLLRVFVHSPTRCYYQLRNCFLLFKRSHIPWLFALREAISVWVSRLALLLFVKNRSAYARAYMAAMCDAFKGIVGKKYG